MGPVLRNKDINNGLSLWALVVQRMKYRARVRKHRERKTVKENIVQWQGMDQGQRLNLDESLVGGGIEPKLEEKEAPLFLRPFPVAITLNCLSKCRQWLQIVQGRGQNSCRGGRSPEFASCAVSPSTAAKQRTG